MANPFSAQQNIQNAVGVQTAAQTAVPFIPNNGNPFTVYNQPLPQGGYLPPVTNAQDQWRVNPVPTQAAPFDFTGWGSYNTQGSPFTPVMPPAPTPGPVTGGPGQQTPVTPPPAGGGGGGGGGAGLTGGAGEYQNPWTQNPNYYNMWGSGASYPQSFSIYGVTPQDLQNPTYITQNQMDSAAASNGALGDFFSGAKDALARKLGVSPGGEISVMQILDLISEPLLPGNIWLEHEGKVSTQNLVKSLIKTVVGPLGVPLLNLIGKVIPSVGKWLEQGKINEALNALGAKIKQEGLDDTAIGTKTVRNRGGNPWDGIGGVGGESGGGGCVVITTKVPGFEKAGDIKVGDTMQTIDAVTFAKGTDEVTYSKPELQPCVLIRTSSGIELECSTTAPIANKDGDQVLAPDLLGVFIPVIDHGEQDYEEVVSIEHIGLRTVQKITCGNKFFLAGKESGRYVLHHNVKSSGFWENRNFNFNTPGVVNVGPVENIK